MRLSSPRSPRSPLTHSGKAGAEVDRLGGLGVTVAEVQVTRVHFFHGEDAGPARRFAAELGGEAVDLTGFAPSPPRGTFEIQLAE